MTTPSALAERITTLEYAVFEQFPATLAPMTQGFTQIYAETVANGEAIAGLRVDMDGFQTSIHRDVSDLKAAIDLQGDSLRKELGVATAGYRGEMTGFREAMSMRFQKVDGQFNALRADMDERFTGVRTDMDERFGAVDRRFEAVDQRFEAVDRRFDGVDQRFDGVDQRLDTLDAKLDTIIAEIRGNR